LQNISRKEGGKEILSFVCEFGGKWMTLKKMKEQMEEIEYIRRGANRIHFSS